MTEHASAQIVVVGASKRELMPLVRRLGEIRKIETAGLPGWSATYEGRRLRVIVTGEGRRCASKSMTQICSEIAESVEGLVVLGVSGALTSDLPAGELVFGTSTSSDTDLEPIALRSPTHRSLGPDSVLTSCRLLTVDRHLDANLLEQIHFRGHAPVVFREAALLPATQGVGDRHLGDAFLDQGLLHGAQPTRLYVCNDQFHGNHNPFLLGGEDLESAIGLHTVFFDVQTAGLLFRVNDPGEEHLDLRAYSVTFSSDNKLVLGKINKIA